MADARTVPAVSEDERRRRRLLFNVAVGVWLLLFAGATLVAFFRMWLPLEQAKEAQVLPEQLGTLHLGDSVQGPEAMAQVARLHGKQIKLADAFVGHYESNDGKAAVVYISVSPTKREAAALYGQMTAKIAKGNRVFSGLSKARAPDGREVYQVQGMGQQHFYYLKDREVVWVAADPAVATAVLDEATRQVR